MNPPAEPGELDLRGYLAVLRRRVGVVILSTVVVVGVALGLSVIKKPVYRASAEVLLQITPSQAVVNQNQQQQNNPQSVQQLTDTEIQIMQSQSVRDAVTKKLGYVPTISATAKGTTQVVVISADDGDKARAMKEANTYAQVYVDVRRQGIIDQLLSAATTIRRQITAIDDQVAAQTAANNNAEVQNLRDRRSIFSQQLDQVQLAASLNQTSGAQIVSKAELPTTPVSPKPLRDGAIALFLGLFLGVGLAFLFEYLDDHVRTKDDLDRVTGNLPVLGLVPALEGWKDRHIATLISLSEPNSAASESYRALRTSLQFMGIERPISLVQVTSPSASEGKTTTLANLGVALARAGRHVVIVDADLRRPRLHQFFGLDNSHGLTSVVLGDDKPNEVFQQVPGVNRLSIVASGPPPPNPSELLSTQAAHLVLRSFADHADCVLIDSPPLLPVADASVIAGVVDATILVVDAKSTTKRGLGRSIELLQQIDAPLVGTVLNGVGAEAAYGYGYGGYGYGYAPRKPTRKERRAQGGERRRTGEEPALPEPSPAEQDADRQPSETL